MRLHKRRFELQQRLEGRECGYVLGMVERYTVNGTDAQENFELVAEDKAILLTCRSSKTRTAFSKKRRELRSSHYLPPSLKY